MYFGPLPDTLLIDGTDIQTLDGVIVTDLSGLMAPGTRRGENVPIPNRNGALAMPKVLDVYQFGVGIAVMPEDEAGVTPDTVEAQRSLFIANVTALGDLLQGANGDGLVMLTRVWSAGVSSVEHDAQGEFVDGLTFEHMNAQTGRTELSFLNLDGAWFASGAPTVPILP